MTNVLRVGIGLLGEGKAVTEEGMTGELAKENSRMQTWISYLSVIGVCAPMIGLLGTVTGMIKAFATLGSSGIGDPSSLSAAIGEVLIATASGLFIAIPAFGAFYFLRNRALNAIHRIEDVINTLFRKMPYETLVGVHIGDEELYAALPNWLVPASEETVTE
jgi:biopolymer transport protein ExbB